MCTLGDQSSSGEAAGTPRGISPAAATRVCLLPFLEGYPRSACTHAILDMDIDDGHRFLPFFSLSFLCLWVNGFVFSSLLPTTASFCVSDSSAATCCRPLFLMLPQRGGRAWVTSLGRRGEDGQIGGLGHTAVGGLIFFGKRISAHNSGCLHRLWFRSTWGQGSVDSTCTHFFLGTPVPSHSRLCGWVEWYTWQFGSRRGGGWKQGL